MSSERDARRAGGPAAAGLAALLAVAPLAPGAAPGPAVRAAGSEGPQEAALDTTSLADGPWSRMEMLLERTLFQVNVLTLTVRLGPAAADRIGELVREGTPGPVLEDSIGRIAARSTDALARLEFRRTVSLGQFVDAVRSNLEMAVDDGYLSAEEASGIGDDLPRWFSFLRERRIHEGDRILYRIRGDTLRTLFLTAADEVLLDQTDVGPERRLAVLGSYFAKGSDFRSKLLRSLLERADRASRSAPGAAGHDPVEPPVRKPLQEAYP